MKYKVIKEDKQLLQDLKSLKVAQIAKEMKVSRQYLYDAMITKFVMSEDFYLKLKEIVNNQKKVKKKY